MFIMRLTDRSDLDMRITFDKLPSIKTRDLYGNRKFTFM